VCSAPLRGRIRTPPFADLIGGPIGDRIGRNPILWISMLGVLPLSLALSFANLFWTDALAVLIGLTMARRRRGYQLHAPDSPEAEALLIERGLTRADLDHAITELERTEGVAILTIVGINYDGLFGSGREGWRLDVSRACDEPFIPMLWLQFFELLGRVPKGSTAKFRADGTLPD
jgi:MFS family permease